MPTTSQAPKVLKGAIVALDLVTSEQRTIVFQYNPATLSRTLQPPVTEPAGNGGARALALRYKGAPVESLNVDIDINAADQLERGDNTTQELGIYPQLAVLEMLLYPKSADVLASDALLDKGQIEVASGYDAPFTLFVWGPQRVLPVTVTSFSITEEIFDTNLNPILASIKLGLRAISYSDLISSHKGYNLFMTYQKNKERLATMGLNRRANELLGFKLSV